MSDRLLRPALVLGLLSCIGPFAIDLYLPAMPTIAASLQTSEQGMQATITAYFIAFGLAQLVYGPWADQAGRKPPLYAGIAVFALGSVICTFAPSVGWLILGRAVQGLGGAAFMVVPRAIIRDLHTGPRATQLMAAVMLVISVSPMLAPLAGSGLMAIAGWRALFAALLVASVVSFITLTLFQPETLAPEHRHAFDMAETRQAAKKLMTDKGFLTLTFLGGFAMASFFVFIAAGAFVYTQHFGLSPTGFSLAFAVNALGFFTASQMAGPLGMRMGPRRVMGLATIGVGAITLALAASALLGFAPLWLMIGGLFAANACLGLVIPTVMVMALDDHGAEAGLASSLGGTLQMLCGGVMVDMAGPFFNGTPAPMLVTIALCGGLAFLLGRIAARKA